MNKPTPGTLSAQGRFIKSTVRSGMTKANKPWAVTETSVLLGDQVVKVNSWPDEGKPAKPVELAEFAPCVVEITSWGSRANSTEVEFRGTVRAA